MGAPARLPVPSGSSSIAGKTLYAKQESPIPPSTAMMELFCQDSSIGEEGSPPPDCPPVSGNSAHRAAQPKGAQLRPGPGGGNLPAAHSCGEPRAHSWQQAGLSKDFGLAKAAVNSPACNPARSRRQGSHFGETEDSNTHLTPAPGRSQGRGFTEDDGGLQRLRRAGGRKAPQPRTKGTPSPDNMKGRGSISGAIFIKMHLQAGLAGLSLYFSPLHLSSVPSKAFLRLQRFFFQDAFSGHLVQQQPKQAEQSRRNGAERMWLRPARKAEATALQAPPRLVHGEESPRLPSGAASAFLAPNLSIQPSSGRLCSPQGINEIEGTVSGHKRTLRPRHRPPETDSQPAYCPAPQKPGLYRCRVHTSVHPIQDTKSSSAGHQQLTPSTQLMRRVRHTWGQRLIL